MAFNLSRHWKHLPSLLLLLLGSLISIGSGILLQRGVQGGMMGFPGLYYGTRCLLQHRDPYNTPTLESFYEASGAAIPTNSVARRQAVTLYVNLPTTFVATAPFALLPLGLAQALWIALLVGSFLAAALLMWDLGAARAHDLSTFLIFFLLANCEILFSGGNTAGFVVSFTVIAVWCFLQQRFVYLGVLCLGVGLAIKPHDAGLIWLFFLLSGGWHRKRALQAAAVAGVIALVAFLWVSAVAPHWLGEFRANLTAISAPGGINEPGPASIGVDSADMIIDLQTVLSVIHDSPSFYNLATYAICGTLFLLWLLKVARSRFDASSAWLALVAASALSMLVTYHRTYDARLLMLAVPACALLRSRPGKLAWTAITFATAAILATSDIPLTVLLLLTHNLPSVASTFPAKLAVIALRRPAPLFLLGTAVTFLAAYIRSTPEETTASLQA